MTEPSVDHRLPTSDSHIRLKPWHFLGLTLGLSWLIWLPAAALDVEFSFGQVAALLALGGAGPPLAALILIYGSGSRGLVSDFWLRIIDLGRIRGGWWAMVLLLPSAVTGVALLLYLGTGNPMPPTPRLDWLLGAPWMLLPWLLMVLVFGPLPEELGWRGYALDALQQRANALIASMFLGIAWATWHLPLFFIEGTWQSGLGLGPTGLWWFGLSIAAQTVIMTVIYNSTNRSTLSAILFHFSVNATGELLPLPEEARMVQVWLWIGIAAILTILFGAQTLSTIPPEDGLLDDIARVRGRGACPWQAAPILINPLRRFILSPEQLVERLELRGDEQVLEIGPGPGYFSPSLAAALPRGRLVLVDLQPQMLAMARERLTATEARDADCVAGDAGALPFADGSFDAVVLVAVLGETPEPPQTLEEVGRVLKPGGLFSDTEQPGDPDHIAQPLLRAMAEEAGFVFERSWGSGSNFTVTFRRPRS